MPVPQRWNEFKRGSRASRPESPLPDAPVRPTTVRRAASNVGQVTRAAGIVSELTQMSTLAPAANRFIGRAGRATQVVSDVAAGEIDRLAYHVGTETLIYGLGQAGFATTGIGPVAALIEHLVVGLNRSQDMAEYLNKLHGYVFVLSSCAATCYQNRNATIVILPPYEFQTTSRNLLREASRANNSSSFLAGHYIASKFIRKYNSATTTNTPNAGVECFRYLMMQAWPDRCTPTSTLTDGELNRARRNASRYIYQNMLCRNMAQERTALQRWARQVTN